MNNENKIKDEVSGILKERGARYGEMKDNSEIKMQSFYMWRTNGIPSYIENTFIEIFSKLSRALSGDPNYLDNYKDIIGYAQKGLDTLRETGDKLTIHHSNLKDLGQMEEIENRYTELIRGSKSYDKLRMVQEVLIFSIYRSCFSIHRKGMLKQHNDIEFVLKSIIKYATNLIMFIENPKGASVTFADKPNATSLLFFSGKMCGGCQDMKPIIKDLGENSDLFVVTVDRHSDVDKSLVDKYYTPFIDNKQVSGLPSYTLEMYTRKNSGTSKLKDSEKYSYTFDGSYTKKELLEIVGQYHRFFSKTYGDFTLELSFQNKE